MYEGPPPHVTKCHDLRCMSLFVIDIQSSSEGLVAVCASLLGKQWTQRLMQAGVVRGDYGCDLPRATAFVPEMMGKHWLCHGSRPLREIPETIYNVAVFPRIFGQNSTCLSSSAANYL